MKVKSNLLKCVSESLSPSLSIGLDPRRGLWPMTLMGKSLVRSSLMLRYLRIGFRFIAAGRLFSLIVMPLCR